MCTSQRCSSVLMSFSVAARMAYASVWSIWFRKVYKPEQWWRVTCPTPTLSLLSRRTSLSENSERISLAAIRPTDTKLYPVFGTSSLFENLRLQFMKGSITSTCCMAVMLMLLASPFDLCSVLIRAFGIRADTEQRSKMLSYCSHMCQCPYQPVKSLMTSQAQHQQSQPWMLFVRTCPNVLAFQLHLILADAR